MKEMKGYKAFKKGLVCAPNKNKPFQFKENTVFEQEDDAVICNSGFHFCKEPLDTLDFYPLIDADGNLTEFAAVEALDEPKTDGGKKYCTKKIKICAKLSIAEFIKASLDFTCQSVRDDAEKMKKDAENGGDAAKLVGGSYAKLVGGSYAQLVGGSYAQLVGGDAAKLVGGYAAKLVGGSYAKLVGGDAAQLAGGDAAQLVGGDAAQLVGGSHSVLIGDNGSIAKGEKGALIVLVEREWRNGERVIKSFKAEMVDGERIKADTFYKLENGEFKEVV